MIRQYLAPVLGGDGVDGNERRGQFDRRVALNESFRVLLVTRIKARCFCFATAWGGIDLSRAAVDRPQRAADRSKARGAGSR